MNKLDKLYDDELYVVWEHQKVNGVKLKRFFISCSCGNNKLLVNTFNMRCQNCGKGHTTESYLRQQNEILKIKEHGDIGGRIRQWIPPAPEQKIIIDPISKKTYVIPKDMKTKQVNKPEQSKTIICPKCKKGFSYGSAQRLSGLGIPLLFFGGEEMCYGCANKLVFAKSV